MPPTPDVQNQMLDFYDVAEHEAQQQAAGPFIGRVATERERGRERERERERARERSPYPYTKYASCLCVCVVSILTLPTAVVFLSLLFHAARPHPKNTDPSHCAFPGVPQQAAAVASTHAQGSCAAAVAGVPKQPQPAQAPAHAPNGGAGVNGSQKASAYPCSTLALVPSLRGSRERRTRAGQLLCCLVRGVVLVLRGLVLVLPRVPRDTSPAICAAAVRVQRGVGRETGRETGRESGEEGEGGVGHGVGRRGGERERGVVDIAGIDGWKRCVSRAGVLCEARLRRDECQRVCARVCYQCVCTSPRPALLPTLPAPRSRSRRQPSCAQCFVLPFLFLDSHVLSKRKKKRVHVLRKKKIGGSTRHITCAKWVCVFFFRARIPLLTSSGMCLCNIPRCAETVVCCSCAWCRQPSGHGSSAPAGPTVMLLTPRADMHARSRSQ